MSKRYLPEVRDKAVRPALERLDEYGSAYAAARAIGPLVDVHHETLRLWIKKALDDAPSPSSPTAQGLSAAEREELARLRKEVRDLEQTNEILKLASAFSRGNSTRDTADRRVHRRIPPGLRRRVDLPRALGRCVDGRPQCQRRRRCRGRSTSGHQTPGLRVGAGISQHQPVTGRTRSLARRPPCRCLLRRGEPVRGHGRNRGRRRRRCGSRGSAGPDAG